MRGKTKYNSNLIKFEQRAAKPLSDKQSVLDSPQKQTINIVLSGDIVGKMESKATEELEEAHLKV